MSKRGVSPLIATIFLVAVAVALGSIVMSLGQEYVVQADMSFSDACTATSFSAKHVAQADDVLTITIDNGEVPLHGFVVKLFNEDYTTGSTERVGVAVQAYAVSVLSIPLEEGFLVHEVNLLPVISGDVCGERGLLITKGSSLFR